MKLTELRDFTTEQVNRIRAEKEYITDLPFQVAHINLTDENDPAAIIKKEIDSLTILSDLHSYPKDDRVFPVNQDENSVFAQHVYQDSVKGGYERVLDIGTGSGVIAMALAKANAKEVIATDINQRSEDFVNKNNEINRLSVRFINSDLFKNVEGKFDKITIDPPFMPAPHGVFPLHAEGGILGNENVVKVFFEECWNFIHKGGCIQGIFMSLSDGKNDTVIDLLSKHLPKGWSYEIKHVFPIKYVPIELYTTCFYGESDFIHWKKEIDKKKFNIFKFFILTIKNNGKNGLIKEEVSKPRLYNLIYPPTTLKYLSNHEQKTKMLSKPVSEDDYPMIGHLIRLSRYNYFIYQTIYNLFY